MLLTSFEPFDGAATNPSADVVELAVAGWDRPERVVTAVLPVSFRGADRALTALLQQHDPDVVVGVGLAGGRRRVGLERVALNLCDARLADNDGDQPADRPVVAGGPLAVPTTLPVKATARHARAAGDDVELSTTAGTFVCNAVFYRAASWAAARPTPRRAGFVHVPWDDVAASARTVRRSVDDALDVAHDDTTAVGATD